MRAARAVGGAADFGSKCAVGSARQSAAAFAGIARALRADCEGPAAGFAVTGIQTFCGAASGGSRALAGAAERLAVMRRGYFAAGDEGGRGGAADFKRGGGYGFGRVFTCDVAGAFGGF